jgi:hypothetical protein
VCAKDVRTKGACMQGAHAYQKARTPKYRNARTPEYQTAIKPNQQVTRMLKPQSLVPEYSSIKQKSKVKQNFHSVQEALVLNIPT